MELYQSKSTWKLILAIVGLLIVIASMVFTNYLATRLADKERGEVELYVKAFESIGSTDPTENTDVSFQFEIISSNKSIPAIVVNDRGTIDYGVNFGEDKDGDQEFLKQQLDEIKSNGNEPIVIKTSYFNQYIYYQHSELLTYLTYYPWFQFLLITAFIGIGYLGFSTTRKAEQNRVWVGMAKETAHQLGTPISAILAWIEHLKIMTDGNEDIADVLKELTNDVNRLDLVADRFSKIGAAPALEKISVFDELEKCKNYMQKRASRKISFHFPEKTGKDLFININPHLFDWVIENLLRNALDAMDGTGKISAHVIEENDFINIEISDTGKGIPPGKLKTVFQPGFTTKKRGWGLGLSLAKRIIESYHSGKIFVKSSIINEGTTFTIKLPKG